MTQVNISLDRSSAAYSAGDVIRGRVELRVTQELKVRGIRLQFYGMARVSWDEKRAYVKGSAPSVAHKNTEVYLDNLIWLLRRGDGEEDILIQPGFHRYPFVFDLAKTLPSSFEGKWGTIRYLMRVTVDRPFRVDDEVTKEFTVSSVIDLNDDPECVRPVGTGSDFTVGLVCCRSGPIMAELRVGRKGFAPGEVIPVYAEIDNGSRRKMFHTRLALIQHTIYRAGDKMKKHSLNICEQERGELLPGEKEVWKDVKLQIPGSLTPSAYKEQKIIQIKYTVTLTIEPYGWDEAFTVPIYVDIGTIPIKKSCVKRYLKQLGQNVGLELTTATKTDGQPRERTPSFPCDVTASDEEKEGGSASRRKHSDTPGITLDVPHTARYGRRFSSGSYDNVIKNDVMSTQVIPEESPGDET